MMSLSELPCTSTSVVDILYDICNIVEVINGHSCSAWSETQYIYGLICVLPSKILSQIDFISFKNATLFFTRSRVQPVYSKTLSLNIDW